MVKNKWFNALIFVGIGIIIGIGIGAGASQRMFARTMPVRMMAFHDLEDIEEFEFEGDGPRFYEYDGDEVELPPMPERGNRSRSGRVVIERVDRYPRMPFMMMRRPFGFGRGIVAFGLIGLGIALLLMRNKNKPSAPVVEEAAPPPSGEDK